MTNLIPLGTQKQRGIISYGVTPNRLNPLAGTAHDAVFNTWRRFSKQVLYFAPPILLGYYVLNWAIEKYGLIRPRPDWHHLLTSC